MPLVRGRARASFAFGFLVVASTVVAACSTFSEEDPGPAAPDAALDAEDVVDASDALAEDVVDVGRPDGPATDYASAVLASNPLRYFRFDEVPGAIPFKDSSPAGSSAIPEGPAITSVNLGAIVKDPTNNALSIAGTSSYLDCGDLVGLQTAPKLAIEVWVRSGPVVNGDQVIVTNLQTTDAGALAGLALRILDTGRVALTVSDGSGSFGMMSGQSLHVGAWTHLAVSYDASSSNAPIIAMWINGQSETVSVSTMGSNPGVKPKGGPLRIGLNAADPAEQYVGDLDELALYTHPLTDADIQRHRAALGP